jgi:carbon monoxide dehydrogenase subunit G
MNNFQKDTDSLPDMVILPPQKCNEEFGAAFHWLSEASAGANAFEFAPRPVRKRAFIKTMVKIEGRYTFDLPIEVVYNALRDEALIREAMPGKVTFRMTTPTHYEAAMTLDVPRFGGHYAGSLDVTGTQVPSYYDLVARGKGLGRDVTARGRVTLTSLPDNRTEVHYLGETDALDHSNRLVQIAAPPICAAFANRGLSHLEDVIQRRMGLKV